MKRNLRTPPTQAVVAARDFAALVRISLAAFGCLVLAVEPSAHERPEAAGAGLAILLATGLLHRRGLTQRWLRVEEPVALVAGVLIVTLGNGGLGPLTLLWLVSAALGVVARGGRASAAGRVVVLAVLVSPVVLHGLTADGATLLVAGCGLLLSVGRVSNETSELLLDPLTGVLSRAALEAEAERMVARATVQHPVTLVLLDLDDFGSLNKREGHQAGDAVLREAARAMAASLRRSDTLGRLGGDEFVVLAAGDGETVAARALAAVRTARIDASAGVVRSPGDGADVPTLLRGADTALRAAKAAGKGRAALHLCPDPRDEALVALDRRA